MSSETERLKTYLGHIVTAIDRIAQYIADMDEQILRLQSAFDA